MTQTQTGWTHAQRCALLDTIFRDPRLKHRVTAAIASKTIGLREIRSDALQDFAVNVLARSFNPPTTAIDAVLIYYISTVAKHAAVDAQRAYQRCAERELSVEVEYGSD